MAYGTGENEQELLGMYGTLHGGHIPLLSRGVATVVNQPRGGFMQAIEDTAEFIKQVRDDLDTNNQMLIQVLATLLEIARRPGITPTEIAQRLGLSVSAAGRNVFLLGREGWKDGKAGRNEGHDLIRIERDRFDVKKKCCYLNTKGERMLKRWLRVDERGLHG